MNLTFIIPSLSSGGSERVISQLANYFAQNYPSKHNIYLITFAADTKQPFYYLESNIKLIQLNVLNQNNNLNIFLRFKNIINRILILRNAIKKIKPNLIISFMEITNIITILASLNLKVPVIVSERTNPSYYIIPKFYQYLRLITYRLAKNIVVQTKSSANFFPNNFKKLIKIIPNAVKLNSKFITLNKFITNIISVGRLDINKDLQTLIYAFFNIIKANPNLNLNLTLTLTIYGEGPYRENLENLIKSINIANKINLPIVLPGTTKDIIEKLTQADLFVFPSRYEGFPNALCEAMSVGLPVIASNCSGNVDIIEDLVNGRLFPVGNIDKLSNIMQELINDFEQREKLSFNARKIAEQFSEQRIYGLWEEVING